MEIFEKLFGADGVVNYLSLAISVLGIFYFIFVISRLVKINSVPGSRQIFLSVIAYLLVGFIAFIGQLSGSPIAMVLFESIGELALSVLFFSATLGFNKLVNYLSEK